MSLREGAAVRYCGDIGEGRPSIGDLGQVLADAGTHAHVMWSTGSRTHQVDLVDVYELAPVASRMGSGVDISDSLNVGPMVSVAVRDTYEDNGPQGLLNALAEAGHLAGLADVADHALAAVSAQIRTDPVLGQVLASLDESESEEFLSLTALALMRESFGAEPDGE